MTLYVCVCVVLFMNSVVSYTFVSELETDQHQHRHCTYEHPKEDQVSAIVINLIINNLFDTYCKVEILMGILIVIFNSRLAGFLM